jgi:hypothetical protein
MLKHSNNAEVECDSHTICMLLTLPIRAEHTFSAASHASCPDGVLVLRDLHKVLKSAGTGHF